LRCKHLRLPEQLRRAAFFVAEIGTPDDSLARSYLASLYAAIARALAIGAVQPHSRYLFDLMRQRPRIACA
jgi:hypothetical protein